MISYSPIRSNKSVTALERRILHRNITPPLHSFQANDWIDKLRTRDPTAEGDIAIGKDENDAESLEWQRTGIRWHAAARVPMCSV